MKLALDLGTTTGFAWTAAAGALVSGTWEFKPKKYEGAGMRYVRFVDALDNLHKRIPVTIICSRRCAATSAPTRRMSMAG